MKKQKRKQNILDKGISTPLALAIIIVLSFVFVGGALGYQYYWLAKNQAEISKTEVVQTAALKAKTAKDETAGWKIYRNEEYGFEFKYPEDDFIPNPIKGENKGIELSANNLFRDVLGSGTVYVSVNQDKEKCLTSSYSSNIRGLDKKLLPGEKEIDGVIFKLGSPTLSKDRDKTGHFYYGDCATMGCYYQIFYRAIKQNLCYEIKEQDYWSSGLYKLDYTKEEIKKIEKEREIVRKEFMKKYSQILSTFRFIKQSLPKPYIKVLSPNGGEKLEIGKTYDIRWESKGVEKVNIEIIDYRAAEQCIIDKDEMPISAESGVYTFKLKTCTTHNAGADEEETLSPGERYKVLISSESQPSEIRDFSDDYFSMVKEKIEFSNKKECEEKTGCKCVYAMCDYVPPGKTYEETCGKAALGWQPRQLPGINDWKTYRNDNYEFEMKYPSEYSVKKYAGAKNSFLTMIKFLKYDNGEVKMPQPYLSVGVYNKPVDINKWLQEYGLGEGWNKNEDFFVNGKKAIYLTSGLEFGAKPIVIIPYKNKIFHLENYATNYFNQMLCAFKFIK